MERNNKLFEQIMIQIATNGRAMEDEEYKKLMTSITNQLGTKKLEDEFSREKFEELRMMTNMGANRG